MTTLSGFRTEVAGVLGLDTGTSAELSLIDGWINEGVQDLVLRSECKVLPATITLTSGYANYTLPDVLSIIDMYVTSGTSNYPLERVSVSEILQRRQVDNSTNSYSPVRLYAVDGSNLLMVYPTPSSADVLHVVYVPRPTTLSATSDTPSEIPSEWHRLVTWYALWRGADYDDDSSSAVGDKYLGWYENGLRQMRHFLYRKGGHRPPRIKVNRRRRGSVAHNPSADVG